MRSIDISKYAGNEPFVFVSYGHVDQEIVYSDIEALLNEEVLVWDDRRIPPASTWREELTHRIAQSSGLILFLSPVSAQRKEVLAEVQTAWKKGKPIVVVCLAETDPPEELKRCIESRQHIFRYRLHEVEYWRRLRLALDTQLFSPPEAPESFWERLRGGRRRNLNISLARAVRAAWLDGFLAPTLAGGVQIEVPLEIHRNGTVQSQPEPFSRARLFAATRRQLVISGDAGAGKTIQLLKFTEELMPVGGAAVYRPIPVVFRAYRWVNQPGKPATEQQGIQEWLTDEFRLQYGFNPGLAKPFIEGSNLIYCFDGFDEIGAGSDPGGASDGYVASLRQRFVDLLGKFLADVGSHSRGVIITSRTAVARELDSLGFCRLHVERLSETQTLGFLAQNCIAELGTLARKDAGLLRELATPLNLQIFSTVYDRADPASDIPEAVGEKDRASFIDNTYREYFDSKIRAFQREESENRIPEFTTFRIYHYIRLLARYLRQTGRLDFRFDRMQPDAMPPDFHPLYRTWLGLVVGTAVFFLVGLPLALAVFEGYWQTDWRTGLINAGFSLIGAAAAGAIVGLSFRFRSFVQGAIVGLAFAVGRATTIGLSQNVPGASSHLQAAVHHGLISLLGVPIFGFVFWRAKENPMKIVPVESWTADRKGAILAALVSAALGIAMWVLLGPARGVAFGVSFGLLAISRFGKRESDRPIQVHPNQAIEFSWHEAIVHTFWITLGAVITCGVSYGLEFGAAEGWNNAVMATVLLFTFFFFGGMPVLKHYALRKTLARADLLPWNALTFFDLAVRCGLLRRVGGSFRFPHQRIRDFFTQE